METCITIIGTINTNTITLRCNCVDVLSNCTTSCYRRLDKIISISGYILLPNNNRIIGSCLRNPACIDRDLITESLFEVILLFCGCEIICDFLGRIPPAKCVSVTNHIRIVRPIWRFCRIDELRSVIGSAFAVFIKNEPVTFWCIYTEHNISGNRNDLIIRIFCTVCVSNDIAAAFADIPSFEVEGFVLNSISHIHFVALFSGRRISAESHLFLAERNIILVKISNAMILKEHCIISNYRPVSFRRQHRRNRCTNSFN